MGPNFDNSTTLGTGQSKHYRIGTHRHRLPEETIALVEGLRRPCGITRVAVVTGLDVIGIPVVMVVRPAGWSLSVSQGKGASLATAKASGLMEAIEHFHAEAPQLPLYYGSVSQMSARERIIELSALPQRAGTNAAGSLLWVRGRSLMDGGALLVPYGLVHLDHRLPLLPGDERFLGSSNGLASGNTLPEATAHGLFELVERHQVAAFYELNRSDQNALEVDVTSVDDDVCQGLLQKVRDAQLGITIWDLSSSLRIPCFMCEIQDLGNSVFRTLQVARGMGCHSAKGIALARAICEAAQSRLTIIAGSRDDISRAAQSTARAAAQNFGAGRAWHATTEGGVSFRQLASWDFETFGQEIQWVLERLEAAGIDQAAIVDLSRAEWPIHVVRIVVPRLRIATQRWAQGSSRVGA